MAHLLLLLKDFDFLMLELVNPTQEGYFTVQGLNQGLQGLDQELEPIVTHFHSMEPKSVHCFILKHLIAGYQEHSDLPIGFNRSF
jgi:hypothetical protein